MSDSRFDHVYDPVATPNPAYDDDFEPAPAPASSWDRRDLAQALLHRARARQEAIADAFVDALLDGKIQLFRILLELEQAAISSEAEAEDARRPGLADILLPMLQRERAQAAAHAATKPNPDQASEPVRPIPSLNAPAASDSTESGLPQPGVTDIQSAADESTTPICRSRTVAHNRRRAIPRVSSTPHHDWKESPETPHQFSPANKQNIRPARQHLQRSRRPHSVPFTILSLTAVADPEAHSAIHIPIRFKSYGMRRSKRGISHRNPLKQNKLHA